MSLSVKAAKIAQLLGVLWLFGVSTALPFESLKLKPSVIIAPISHIQWNNRGDWHQNNNFVDPDPHSFIIRRSSHVGNIIKPITDISGPVNNADDQMTLPSYVSFMVKHPRSKSLEISYSPELGDTISSLKITDNLFNGAQNAVTSFPKMENTSTKRPIRRPTLSTRRPLTTTRRPRPQNRPKPQRPKPINKNKQAVPEGEIEETDAPASTTTPHPMRPQNNHLAGQSQIGNRETQMVIKPTVIVNIRGTVSNTDSEIKVESRAEDEDGNSTSVTVMPQNVFHINQEVNIENTYSMDGEADDSSQPASIKTVIKPKHNKKQSEISAERKSDETIIDTDTLITEDISPRLNTQSVIYELKIIGPQSEKLTETLKLI